MRKFIVVSPTHRRRRVAHLREIGNFARTLETLIRQDRFDDVERQSIFGCILFPAATGIQKTRLVEFKFSVAAETTYVALFLAGTLHAFGTLRRDAAFKTANKRRSPVHAH